MRQIELPGGASVPILGQGTWRIGEERARASAEREALLAGIDDGMTLIDTAEMYGDGATETFLGETLAGRRHEIFLVSKAYPQNASRKRLPAACEASLRPLSVSMSPAVNASASEIRQPIWAKVKHRVRTSGAEASAAAMNRRRSASVRYFR